MNSPPWTVLNFQPMTLPARQLIDLASDMRLSGFSIDQPCRRGRVETASCAEPRCGQVLFTANRTDGVVAAAWHWAEWSEGVVCIQNPCAALTNVTIVDESGAELPCLERIALLNSLLYRIDWQHLVISRLPGTQPQIQARAQAHAMRIAA